MYKVHQAVVFKDLKTLSYVDFFYPTSEEFEYKTEAKTWIAAHMIPNMDERMGTTEWEDQELVDCIVNDWMVDNQMFLMEVTDGVA
jgi:hypothetical protein